MSRCLRTRKVNDISSSPRLSPESKGRSPMSQFQDSKTERVNSPFLSPFVPFRPSVDWMMPTALRRTVCFTQSMDSNVSLIQKHPHRCTQNNVSLTIWAPVKLTHKINYCGSQVLSYYFYRTFTFPLFKMII